MISTPRAALLLTLASASFSTTQAFAQGRQATSTQTQTPPPYQMKDNPNTWLDQTDLVFIDPVGTGCSRAKTVEIARRMNGVQGDLQSVGEFIRMYVTRNERTLSPLFIAGESYGTFRAAG